MNVAGVECSALPLETYIPTKVMYASRELGRSLAVTLYEPDGDAPHGALTTHTTLPEGERSGPLIFEGRRDEQLWRITLPEIEVVRSSSLGFEFNIFGKVQRETI